VTGTSPTRSRTMSTCLCTPSTQFGAVTAANEELLDTWAKDATLDLQFRPSLVPLGVNNPDPTGSDGDVVDVGLRSRDAPIVEDS
jgi:hypothetical protein